MLHANYISIKPGKKIKTEKEKKKKENFYGDAFRETD